MQKDGWFLAYNHILMSMHALRKYMHVIIDIHWYVEFELWNLHHELGILFNKMKDWHDSLLNFMRPWEAIFVIPYCIVAYEICLGKLSLMRWIMFFVYSAFRLSYARNLRYVMDYVSEI